MFQVLFQIMSNPQPPAPLAQAQQQAWLHQQPLPETSRQALTRLQETVRRCLEAFDADQLVPAQALLEDSLVALLVAMKTLNMHPDQALARALERLQAAAARKAFHIFADRVEIRVGEEVRGAWPLYGEADYESALQLARELGCDVIHHEASQLGLFNPGATHERDEPHPAEQADRR